MTFEERMDRLTERHEALAQTVELLAVQSERNEKTVDVLMRSVQDLVGIVRSHEARIGRLESQ